MRTFLRMLFLAAAAALLLAGGVQAWRRSCELSRAAEASAPAG